MARTWALRLSEYNCSPERLPESRSVPVCGAPPGPCCVNVIGSSGKEVSIPSSTDVSTPATWISLTVIRVAGVRSEEHTSELQSRSDLVCRLLLEKKKQD